MIYAAISEEQKKYLRKKMEDGNVSVHFYTDEPEKAGECEVLFLFFMNADRVRAAVERMPSLKLLQTLSAGVERLPFEAIPESVTVCSNAAAYSEPIAEHALAMMLALSKRLKANEIKLKEGEYDSRTHTAELAGRMLGIIGYGGIGRAVARLGRCLGMKIYAVSRQPAVDGSCDFSGGLEALPEMLKISNIVVISAPLNKQTAGLMDRERLSMMREDAILINVARGGIIVEEALYERLVKFPSFSAGIDVWWNEPGRGERFSQKFDFISLPNFIGSPHNSAMVEGIEERAVDAALENIRRYINERRPRNVVKRNDYI